jgi:hypothetical protein
MILNSAPQDQAVLSNVGQIGEFRIRNSAKAFSILSSGLYANKVRAIIRELSCNAVDSHTAAGKTDTPFDVHLPNSLEPWFSIRDYGTGLSADQVTNIYTTYFESTKTSSNEFIGALGLGSKSPFSYTDNFTVTAIQNGIKGIYTAFINESGVPSIAQMMTENTTDPNGVEVKFSVNDRYDFEKFRSEARSVYKYFKQRPVVSGSSGFQFTDPEYAEKDIIPGVHQVAGSHSSYAIMGNIAYPIDIPQADQTLGNFRGMLGCGLVMEFAIGELDFQASREGLSYIPQTIESIKRKLEQVNAQLAIHITTEANKITNTWEKALYLDKRNSNQLWSQAVVKYVTDTKFEYLSTKHCWGNLHTFKLSEEDLKSKHNILLRGFNKSRSYSACTNLKAKSTSAIVNNQPVFTHYWDIAISSISRFVINDTKVGATERAKYHAKESNMLKGNDGLNQVNMYVIEAYDKTKPIDVAGFKTLLANPPEAFFMKASTLLEKERKDGNIGKNVTIMRLESRGSGGYYRRDEMVWRDAGKADSFDDKATHYYIPLSGFTPQGSCSDVKSLTKFLRNSNVFRSDIYGVRKTDLEWVKLQKNWVELDQYIIDQLHKMDKENIMGLVKQALDIDDLISYNSNEILSTSPFAKLVNTFKDVKKIDTQVQHAIEWLSRLYDVKSSTNVSPQALIDKYKGEASDIIKRYPLLKHVSGYSVNKEAVAEYINLIDQTKGV